MNEVDHRFVTVISFAINVKSLKVSYDHETVLFRQKPDDNWFEYLFMKEVK